MRPSRRVPVPDVRPSGEKRVGTAAGSLVRAVKSPPSPAPGGSDASVRLSALVPRYANQRATRRHSGPRLRRPVDAFTVASSCQSPCRGSAAISRGNHASGTMIRRPSARSTRSSSSSARPATSGAVQDGKSCTPPTACACSATSPGRESVRAERTRSRQPEAPAPASTCQFLTVLDVHVRRLVPFVAEEE